MSDKDSKTLEGKNKGLINTDQFEKENKFLDPKIARKNKELPEVEIFIFESYSFDEGKKTAYLNYSFDGKTKFTEEIKFDFDYVEYDKKGLDLAIQGLWLLAGVSYYKALLPKKIEIKDREIDEWQAEFLNKTYTLGLGEFFFKNKLDFRDLINFPVSKSAQKTGVEVKNLDGAILPIGGGKDSLVSSVLLKEKGVDYDTITVGVYPFLDKMIRKIGKKHLTVTRKISPELIKLNEGGAFNGHVPISSIWASIFVVSAILSGKNEVVLSNEASANEGNLEMFGKEINHQYSKSLEFENDFDKWVQNYISPSLHYYSLLRKYSELEITKIFVEKCWQDFKFEFISCNKNFTIKNNSSQKRWCGKCDKCCFVGIMLAAYLPRKEVTNIFGKDIFKDPENVNIFEELSGKIGYKPFECVGTPEEVREAIKMAVKHEEYSDLKRFL